MDNEMNNYIYNNIFEIDFGFSIFIKKKKYSLLTRAVLSVLLILWMEIVNSIRHNVFWIHCFLYSFYWYEKLNEVQLKLRIC